MSRIQLLTAERIFNPKTLFLNICYGVIPIIVLVVNYSAVVLALITTFYIRDRIIPIYFPTFPQLQISSSYQYFVIPFIYIALILYEKFNSKRLPFWKLTEKAAKICFYATILSVGVIYFTGSAKEISRTFVFISGFFCFIYLIITSYLAKTILVFAGLWQKPIVIVGSGRMADILAEAYEKRPDLGFKVAGIIGETNSSTKYPIIGDLNNIEEVIESTHIKDVVIAAPCLKEENLLDLVYTIQPLVENLKIIPDLQGLPVENMEIESLFHEKIIMLKIRNHYLQTWKIFAKRFLDLTLGTLGFVLILPVFLFIMLLIRMDSSGPVFYVAKRLGKNGKEFDCYKFRTMFPDNDDILKCFLDSNPEANEEWKTYAKLREFDPRLTRVGKWLRKYSLDELPQIFNVLIGNMSLVGPRPYLPRELEEMGSYKNIIFEIVPGITGLWQVSGRNDIKFDGRLALDSWYIRNWSFWLDISILFRTFKVVLKQEGAY